MKKIATIFMSFVFIIAGFSFTYAENPTATINGQHIVENDTSLKSFNNVFVLKSIDNAPMPEGSSNGVKEITSLSNEDFSFGAISFRDTGTYEYRVERSITESKSLKADNSVYLVKIQVHQNGTTSIIYQKEGQEGKSDSIKYIDTYIKPYTIIFDPDGGIFEDGTTENKKIVDYAGTQITILNAPTKEGYTFLYWEGSKYYPGDIYTITENHMFIARYEKNSSQEDIDHTNDTDDTKKDKTKKDNKAKTGDSNKLALYLSMFIICTLSVLIIYIKSKERKNTK